MAARTGQQLMDTVRTLGRYEAPFLTDAELLEIVNAKLASFRQLLAMLDESRILKTGTVTVTAGTAAFALPTDCGQVLAVVVSDSRTGSGYVELEHINWRDRYRLTTSCTSQSDARYAVRGDRQIWFWPVPSWSGTVSIDYLPLHADIAAVDSIDFGVDGWDRWVCYAALEVVATKALDETGGWTKLRGDEEQRLGWAARVDRARPRRMSPTLPPAGDWRY